MVDKKRIDKKTGRVKGGSHGRKQTNARSLANLKHWKPGESGNPSGKSHTIVEITRLARDLTPAAIMRLNSIVHDPDALDRDVIAAAIAISDRGCGKPPMGVFHGSGTGSPMMELDENGEPISALIIAASRRKEAAYKLELQAELRRIEQAEERERAEQADRLAEARAAQARGEEIPGMTALLLAARDVNEDSPPPNGTVRRVN